MPSIYLFVFNPIKMIDSVGLMCVCNDCCYNSLFLFVTMFFLSIH